MPDFLTPLFKISSTAFFESTLFSRARPMACKSSCVFATSRPEITFDDLTVKSAPVVNSETESGGQL